MTQRLHVPISPGELLDKITILEIKVERITDPAKRANVAHELSLLEGVWKDSALEDEFVVELRARLRSVNEALWDIEDAIRAREHAGDFGAAFIELARLVYIRNDERAALKKRVNVHLGSEIVEEKSYHDHGRTP